MLEQLINALDQRGILVMQAMLGKRAIELLEDENEKKSKPKLEVPTAPSIVTPTKGLITGPNS